jgi:hypothetical protein
MAVISAPHLSIDICLSFTPSASLVASVQIMFFDRCASCGHCRYADRMVLRFWNALIHQL